VLKFFRRHKTATMVSGLALLIIVSLAIPVTVAELLEWGTRLSGHPLVMLGVVVLMAVLMTFGLAGSLCFWLIAPFHPPWLSVCMLLAGSFSGALGAYRVGVGLGQVWHGSGVSRHIMGLLKKRSDLLTQCALRIIPGVPHALVNLAAGVLRLRLVTFVAAAILGLSVKWTVYSHTVHGMVSASQAEEAMELGALMPLVVLGVLLVLGGAAQRYWLGKHS
jgi:uncharacterized membrane protein YdjX (TVP38/TMEM64 family)